jgi:hypothetical protein
MTQAPPTTRAPPCVTTTLAQVSAPRRAPAIAGSGKDTPRIVTLPGIVYGLGRVGSRTRSTTIDACAIVSPMSAPEGEQAEEEVEVERHHERRRQAPPRR